MKHPTPDYPALAVKEALQSLIGAGFAIISVCLVASAIPSAALWAEMPDTEDLLMLAFGWVGHWVLAGLMFWGLLAMLVPVWCFYELIHGSRSPVLVLAAAFIAQSIVSTVAVCTFAYEDERTRPLVASGAAVLVVVVISLWTSLLIRRKVDAEQATPANCCST